MRIFSTWNLFESLRCIFCDFFIVWNLACLQTLRVLERPGKSKYVRSSFDSSCFCKMKAGINFLRWERGEGWASPPDPAFPQRHEVPNGLKSQYTKNVVDSLNSQKFYFLSKVIVWFNPKFTCKFVHFVGTLYRKRFWEFRF